MKVCSVEEIREFDRAAVEQFHLPAPVLMENAALRVLEFLEHRFGSLSGKHIVVLCGKGNNGGDGFAVARHLLGRDCHLTVLLAAQPDEMKGDAAANYAAFAAGLVAEANKTAGLIILPDEALPAASPLPVLLRDADIVLDALLGTGFRSEVRGCATRVALDLLRQAGGTRIAVDLPSGLDANSGQAAPEAVPAEATLTFVAPKLGFFLRDGIDLCGEVWVGGIGTTPAQMQGWWCTAQLLDRATAGALLPRRQPDAHKGDAGKVVVLGGSLGMSGAPCLASRAALAVGAGLCVTCLPERVQPVFAAAVLEATSHALACDAEGRLVERAADALAEIWKGAQVVALGPGLSRAEGAFAFARRVVRECRLPLIIDADALYALREIAGDVGARVGPTILTPHPGEMGELLGLPTTDVQTDRIAAARQCAERYGAFVVLKGARSIVATPQGELWFNVTGNAGMATGGSGDVLTGTIAGLLAQLRDAEAATRLAVYLHGLAGDLAFAERGKGLVAGDIAAHLPAALLAAGKLAPRPALGPRRIS